jgi:hypothetical protein
MIQNARDLVVLYHSQREIVSTEQLDAGVSSLFNPSLFHLQPFVFPSTAPISQPQQSKLTSATHSICPSTFLILLFSISTSSSCGQSISSPAFDCDANSLYISHINLTN